MGTGLVYKFITEQLGLLGQDGSHFHMRCFPGVISSEQTNHLLYTDLFHAVGIWAPLAVLYEMTIGLSG